jgi:hypothetical protein
MKHKKKKVALGAAAVIHGLCPKETGHEHVPNETAVDVFSLAAKTTIMDTSTAVLGLPIVNLAKVKTTK